MLIEIGVFAIITRFFFVSGIYISRAGAAVRMFETVGREKRNKIARQGTGDEKGRNGNRTQFKRVHWKKTQLKGDRVTYAPFFFSQRRTYEYVACKSEIFILR